MIKQKPLGMSQKELLQAKAQNKLYSFILDSGIRGAILYGTHMINEMRAAHNLGILETLVLGHSYLGAGLIIATLKGKDRVALTIECSGPIRGLSVEADAAGEVRGYLKANPIPIEIPLESFDLSPYFGDGYLTITKYPQYAKHPYSGQIKLKPGSIASNLTQYYWVSEQTPTSFNVSIKFDEKGEVIGAGGLYLQSMPGTPNDRIRALEIILETLPSIGEVFANRLSPQEFVLSNFHAFSPRILADRRIEFFCRCQKETITQIIQNLPIDTLADMAINGPFPLETHCRNCNTTYSFEKEEIDALFSKRIQ